MRQKSDWPGRFPRNEIISLPDVNRRYNLAESTAQDLTFGEILNLAGGAATLSELKMGYGSSAENVLLVLEALESALKRQGYAPAGDGRAAAEKTLSASV